MKVSRKYHIRKTGTGKGKIRKNPQLNLEGKDLSLFGGASELDLVIENLDPFEERIYKQVSRSRTPLKALEIIVNSVEGDDSQLSPLLRAFAKKKGWLYDARLKKQIKNFEIDYLRKGKGKLKDYGTLLRKQNRRRK